jgi:hypothetical protein
MDLGLRLLRSSLSRAGILRGSSADKEHRDCGLQMASFSVPPICTGFLPIDRAAVNPVSAAAERGQSPRPMTNHKGSSFLNHTV